MPRTIIPLTLKDADVFVRRWHRVHKSHPQTKFHRFSLGLVEDGKLIGAIIVGFPMALKTDLHQVAEVNRLAADGSKDASSQLLAAAARVVREMGFARFQMFVEPGERTAPSFLKAARFRFDGVTSGKGVPWDHPGRKDGRLRRPRPGTGTHRWVLDFRPIESVTPARRKCDGCKEYLPVDARPNRRTHSAACRQRLYRKKHPARCRAAG